MTYIYLAIGISCIVVLICLLLFATSVSRYSKYWEERNSHPIDNSITYVALGDSAAQGIGATSPDKGYVGIIAKRLEKESNRPVRVINLSKSGAKINDVLQHQFQLLNHIHADVITIEIGANDMQTFNEEEFKKQAEELFRILPNTTFISDIPYFGGRSRFINPEFENNVLVANKILEEIAEKNNKKLVRLHQASKQRNNLPWTYAIDYFHPNNLGYITWADAFWEAIIQ